jgi:hypothetical protein
VGNDSGYLSKQFLDMSDDRIFYGRGSHSRQSDILERDYPFQERNKKIREMGDFDLPVDAEFG